MKYYPHDINEYFANGQVDRLIQVAESRHTIQFEQLRRLITFSCNRTLDDHLTAAVLVTGPSSSGKTTFSNRLSALMEEEGFHCTVISIDDYYHSRDEIARRQPNAEKPDYEILDAFNVSFFQEQMRAFLSGESIHLPRYDFTLGKRVDSGRVLTPTQKDLLIIEGIHAMNPKLTEGLAFARTIGVYICPFDSYKIPGKGDITSREIRLMRRSLRDLVHRNSGIMKTLDMWPSVRAGEERYIKPMKQYADFFFNSSFEYEICILKARLEKQIATLTAEERERLAAYLPLDLLAEFHSCPEANIPSDSIFNEFYR
ncbi:MAG: hypothetical protein IJD11_01285 [Oscillospiraceae bacterium]|nr:hypothetical protein [Oscillospiraceae bacterium]